MPTLGTHTHHEKSSMIQASASKTDACLSEADQFGAYNYKPLPVVLERGEGVWVWDVSGNRYLDMLSAYSALNQGHRHPAVVRAAEEQMSKLTLTSRAFHNDQMGPFLRELCEATGYEKALPMNTGAEAVETAIKTVRKWGYQVKGVPEGKAEIIVCENNFHGRTTTIVGFSSEDQYREGFGPFTPGSSWSLTAIPTRSRLLLRRIRWASSSSRCKVRGVWSFLPRAT